MSSMDALAALPGSTLHSASGEKIGKILDVYESAEGAHATFVTVSHGLFGGGVSFVPLAQANLDGDHVVVPYDGQVVHNAPRIDSDEELTAQEEDRLYQHYNLPEPAEPAASVEPAGSVEPLLIRSEERLHIGTERVESGRARMRKRIITDIQSQTVAVSHQEVSIDRVPVAGGLTPAYDRPGSTELPEVVLTRELPVIGKETVAVEQVRLGIENVLEQVTVSEQVRKENLEVDRDLPL